MPSWQNSGMELKQRTNRASKAKRVLTSYVSDTSYGCSPRALSFWLMSWQELGQSGWEKWNGHLIQIVSLRDNYVFLRVPLDSKISNPAWPQLKTIAGNGAAAHAIASPCLSSSARWMSLSWHPQPLVFRSSLVRVRDWHRLGFCAGAVL